jgi:hypothetical protein
MVAPILLFRALTGALVDPARHVVAGWAITHLRRQ